MKVKTSITLSKELIAYDELVSLPKSLLTHHIGILPPRKMGVFNQALKIALDVRGGLTIRAESLAKDGREFGSGAKA